MLVNSYYIDYILHTSSGLFSLSMDAWYKKVPRLGHSFTLPPWPPTRHLRDKLQEITKTADSSSSIIWSRVQYHSRHSDLMSPERHEPCREPTENSDNAYVMRACTDTHDEHNKHCKFTYRPRLKRDFELQRWLSNTQQYIQRGYKVFYLSTI